MLIHWTSSSTNYSSLTVACAAVFGAPFYFAIRRESILRIPMASETIAHAHRHVLPDNLHLLNFPVTGLTEDSRVHVRPVVEKYVVRQRVDPLPFHRPAGGIGGGNHFDQPAIRFRNSVTVHALGNGWNGSLRRFERVCMAVETWNPHGASVKFVRIGNWLYRFVPCLKPAGLRKPAYCQNRQKNRRYCGGHNKAGIVQKVLLCFPGKLHAQVSGT
jgi:hypothetical protein